jgi:hypothetical protein
MGPHRKRLFHSNGFDGTLAHADAAINARIGYDLSLAAFHLDRLAGARFKTSLATCAFSAIYFCRHNSTLSYFTDFEKNDIIQT